MRLSSKSQYGLKACYILALNYPEKCVSASSLEKEIAVSGKYIEELKGGRLNALVAAFREDTVEKLLQFKLLHKLTAINVPHALGRM